MCVSVSHDVEASVWFLGSSQGIVPSSIFSWGNWIPLGIGTAVDGKLLSTNHSLTQKE